jgi:hypothetical protein
MSRRISLMGSALVLACIFLVQPSEAQQQPASQFNTCTLNLFDASLSTGTRKTITFSTADSTLESLPDGSQRASIANLGDPSLNFDKQANAYTFMCQGTSGNPQAVYTFEKFCPEANLQGQCFLHSAINLVSRDPRNSNVYQVMKGDFSLPQKNAYSSFEATIRPR